MIIVTGGAGFIGSAFVAKLNQQGIFDIVIVDELDQSSKWRNLVGKRYLEYIHKDQLFSSGVLDREISAIVHMGACSATTELDMDFLYRNNFLYTRKLAELCLARNVRFIYASSAATYGDGAEGFDDDEAKLWGLKPINPYGYSKHIFDLWASERGLFNKLCGLKFFNVYGPNEHHKGEMRSVIAKSFDRVISLGRVELFKSHRDGYRDGEQKRDFVYVKDCVEVMWWLLNTPTANGLFNLGTGMARTWNDLMSAVFKACQKPAQIDYIDMPEKLRGQYQYFTEASMQKLRQAGCPVAFHSLEDGVADYVLQHLIGGRAL